ADAAVVDPDVGVGRLAVDRERPAQQGGDLFAFLRVVAFLHGVADLVEAVAADRQERRDEGREAPLESRRPAAPDGGARGYRDVARLQGDGAGGQPPRLAVARHL